MASTYILLFEVTPLAGSNPITLRLTNNDADSNATNANGLAWLPCITKLPTISVTLSDDGMMGDLQVSRGDIQFFCSADYENFVWSSYLWNGATGRAWLGAPGSTFDQYQKLFEGKVTSLERDGNLATIRLSGPEADLTGDVLTAEYAGTGGAEGTEDLTGTLKPRCYGSPKSIGPIQVDSVNLVYQVHGYGPVASITPYEFGSPLDPLKFMGDAATYEDLIALSMVPSEWATCLAQGMFRFGGTPTPKVSADVTMPSGTTLSAVATQLLRDGGVPDALIGDFTNIGYVATTLYLTSQASMLSTAQDLFKQAGTYLIADKDGVWQSGNFYNSTKAPTTLEGDRSTFPLLLDFKEEPTKAPVWKVRYGYDRCWDVHTDGEASPIISQISTSVTSAVANSEAALAATDDMVAKALSAKLNQSVNKVVETATAGTIANALANYKATQSAQTRMDGIDDKFDQIGDQITDIVETKLEVMEVAIAGTTSRIEKEEEVRADETASLTRSITQQTSRLDNFDGLGTSLESSIRGMSGTLVANGQTEAAHYLEVTSSLSGLKTDVQSQIVQINRTMADNNSTQSEQYNSLLSRFNGFNGTGNTVEAAITGIADTVASNNEARVQQINGISARLDRINGGSSIESTITDLRTAISNVDGAQSSNYQQLNSRFNTMDGTVTNIYTTIANGDRASADALLAVQSDMNGRIAGVSQQFNSTQDQINGIRNTATVRLDGSGAFAGWTLINGTNITSAMIVDANLFQIRSNGTGTDFQNGLWQITNSNGVVQMQWGIKQ